LKPFKSSAFLLPKKGVHISQVTICKSEERLNQFFFAAGLTLILINQEKYRLRFQFNPIAE
jgi:hypothetical protein